MLATIVMLAAAAASVHTKAAAIGGRGATEHHLHLRGSGSAAVTYTHDIAPILYQNCDTCHRPGQISPFPLNSYADAKKHARQIAEVTQIKLMPPWKAESGFGHFVGERRLSDSTISTIRTWVNTGALEGKLADLPVPPKYPEGWALGKPDVVLQPSEPYSLSAEGADVYRCFVIPTSYTEDRWLAGMEVHPGNRKVVHHIIAYLDTSGAARKLEAAGPGPGYTSFGGPGFSPSGSLGGWVPGYDSALLPAGIGIFLPKGADIVLQVHYHKDGKPETDLTKIGLFFTKAPVDKRLRTLPIIDQNISIPAGDPDYVAHASYTVPLNVTLRDILPHMHLIGRNMTVVAHVPDAVDIPLIKIDDWDFNWQNKYVYQHPIKLPKGTKIDLVAHYNNSLSNPRNPNDPPKAVTWGEQTTDEMCIAFLGYTVDAEHLTKGEAVNSAPDFARAREESAAESLISKFDRDSDGTLDESEFAALLQYYKDHPRPGHANGPLQFADTAKLGHSLLLIFDKDNDGTLNADELATWIKSVRKR